MSHDATAWARKQQTGNGPAKFLLLMLADYAGSDYSCWPSQDTLASLTEMNERTVRRATALLVERGLIRVFYRYRDDHSRRSCRYQLLPDGADTELPETVDWSAMKQAEPAGPPDSLSADPPDRESAPTGLSVRPHRTESPVIPSTEPSLESSPLNLSASRPKTATRIPDDYIPDQQLRDWFAAEHLHQVIDIRTEHDKFVDYWLGAPGVKGRKLDWPATWRNWMRTAAERAGRRPGNGLAVSVSGAPYRPSTTDQKVAQTLDLGRRLQAMEENR